MQSGYMRKLTDDIICESLGFRRHKNQKGNKIWQSVQKEQVHTASGQPC